MCTVPAGMDSSEGNPPVSHASAMLAVQSQGDAFQVADPAGALIAWQLSDQLYHDAAAALGLHEALDRTAQNAHSPACAASAAAALAESQANVRSFAFQWSWLTMNK